MRYNPRALVFNWKVNGELIEEKFTPFDHNPIWNEFEICDYIFQMYSAYNSYRYDLLKESSTDIDNFFSNKIALDDSFLGATKYLKHAFSSICEFEVESKRRFNDKRELNKEEIAHHRGLRQQFIPSSLFYMRGLFSIRKNLYESIKEFEKTGDMSIMDTWVNNAKESFQRKANEIVEKMEEMYQNDEWDDFEETLKQKEDAKQLMESLSKIKVNSKKYEKAFALIEALANGYKKYVKNSRLEGGGCYALCIADGKKYYSLSGIDDYVGNNSEIKNLCNNKNLKTLINILSPAQGFTYAPLSDNVTCYGFWHGKAYIQKSLKLKDFIDMCNKQTQLINKINPRDFSCCERKIMAESKRKAKNYKFFIRFEPCFLCMPDLVPNEGMTIVSFVPSDDRKKLRKLAVKAIKGPPYYEFI